MGAALRLPIANGITAHEIADLCKKRDVKLIASSAAAPDPRSTIEDASLVRIVRTFTEANFKRPVAVVFGREASGVSPDVSTLADELIHIPMAAGVESLNVAAAGAIILYEAARQRGFDRSRGEG
jgi:tRNA G18 (ribose-2'-O)-methylase SpoU